MALKVLFRSQAQGLLSLEAIQPVWHFLRNFFKDIIIFDAGTGIRKLGKELIEKDFHDGQRIALGFSHFHWDHIRRFPFFDPAYDVSKDILLITHGEKLKQADGA